MNLINKIGRLFIFFKMKFNIQISFHLKGYFQVNVHHREIFDILDNLSFLTRKKNHKSVFNLETNIKS